MATNVKSRRAWIRPLGTLVLLGLLFWLVPFEKVWDKARLIPASVWLAAMAVYVTLHFVSAVKLYVVVRSAGGGLPLRVAARCYFAGLFGNLLLPSVIGGDAITIAVGLRHTQNKAGLVLGCLGCRLLDLFVLCLLAGISALNLPSALDAKSRRVFIGVGVMAVLGFVGLLAGLRVARGRIPPKILRKLVSARQAFTSMRGSPGGLFSAVLLSAIAQAGFVVINAWIGERCGLHLRPSLWMFAVLMAKLAAFIPLGQAGIGVREFAFAALLLPFGIAKDQAIAVSLVWQSVVISGALLGGLISLLLARGDTANSVQSSKDSFGVPASVSDKPPAGCEGAKEGG